MDGSFQPTYKAPSELVEQTPVGSITNSPAYYASDQTAQQLATRNAPELVAEELKRAQQALGEIVGAESSDELLGRIFARFCIGK